MFTFNPLQITAHNGIVANIKCNCTLEISVAETCFEYLNENAN